MIVNQLKGTFIDWDNVTNKTVALRLMQVMREHVGKKNNITKQQLFQNVFGLDLGKVSDLNYHVLLKYLSCSIAYLRKHSNLFIIATSLDGNKVYFVPRTVKELDEYNVGADNRIEGLKNLKKRAAQSVKERWYNKEWVIEKVNKDE